jgi:hypothetical protein
MSSYLKSILFVVFLCISSTANAQELSCFENFSNDENQIKVESVNIQSSGVKISGTLYAPNVEGRFPALILMPGGGDNVTNLRDVPHYLAKRAAACGIIALAYDKRGTGNSSGDYSSSDFIDFLDDASAGVTMLASLPQVDTAKIGAAGFSQGGRLVANLAVRNKQVSFIASVSGPIYPVGLTRHYALKNYYAEAQISEATLKVILPLWEEHFMALESNDDERSIKLDSIIEKAMEKVSRNLLPPFYKDVPEMPIYNSMGIDLISELGNLKIPWLSLYGELDRVVPVEESIENIKSMTKIAGNNGVTIRVIPNGSHSLYNAEEGKSYPFEAEIIKWVLSITDN